MFGRTVILFSVVFGLVAGSCVEVLTPQKCSHVVSVPLHKSYFHHHSEPEWGSSLVSVSNDAAAIPVVSDNAITGSSATLPIVSERVISGPACSTSVVPDVFSSSSSFTPVTTNENSLSGVDSPFEEFVKSSETFEPESAPLPVVQAPSVTFPAIETPLITLCAPAVPAPKVLASKCVCTKTVVKPQIFQRVVTIPRVQRFLKRTVTPIIENVIYKARPVSNHFDSSGSSVVVSGPSNGGSNSLVLSSPSSVLVPDNSCSRVC